MQRLQNTRDPKISFLQQHPPAQKYIRFCS
jgi:hypothetical protein